jgi:hypothetical protein
MEWVEARHGIKEGFAHFADSIRNDVFWVEDGCGGKPKRKASGLEGLSYRLE